VLRGEHRHCYVRERSRTTAGGTADFDDGRYFKTGAAPRARVTSAHLLPATLARRRLWLLLMSLNFIVSVSDDTAWAEVVVKAPPPTLCVVDVYTEWCGPCSVLEHKFQQLHVDLVSCDIKVRF
jgi:hypothetical protein